MVWSLGVSVSPFRCHLWLSAPWSWDKIQFPPRGGKSTTSGAWYHGSSLSLTVSPPAPEPHNANLEQMQTAYALSAQAFCSKKHSHLWFPSAWTSRNVNFRSFLLKVYVLSRKLGRVYRLGVGIHRTFPPSRGFSSNCTRQSIKKTISWLWRKTLLPSNTSRWLCEPPHRVPAHRNLVCVQCWASVHGAGARSTGFQNRDEGSWNQHLCFLCGLRSLCSSPLRAPVLWTEDSQMSVKLGVTEGLLHARLLLAELSSLTFFPTLEGKRCFYDLGFPWKQSLGQGLSVNLLSGGEAFSEKGECGKREMARPD